MKEHLVGDTPGVALSSDAERYLAYLAETPGLTVELLAGGAIDGVLKGESLKDEVRSGSELGRELVQEFIRREASVG
jgi:hypothetical protein